MFESAGEMTLEAQQRIWALAARLSGRSDVREAVPGMNNLMLVLDAPPASQRAWMDLAVSVQRLWEVVEPLPLRGRVIELGVVYGGEGGPHIRDVAEHTGLDVARIAALHSAPTYPVYALGSHPGYCYLGGMDPRLATPRRAVPLMGLPGGSVSIGGVQTGVSASAGPSGWNTIGRTELAFFDHRRTPAALLRPGDQIRFNIERIAS
ncbi:5-oxoprolinase subunit PxpB [Xanthomonas sp. Kuri4-1]